jgi:hypothetical protein
MIAIGIDMASLPTKRRIGVEVTGAHRLLLALHLTKSGWRMSSRPGKLSFRHVPGYP